jgi:hypothetical protein
VLGQRALRAEPATASTVAAIQIIARTECHCACPKGSTSKGERETLRGRHDSRRPLYRIRTPSPGQARLLNPMWTWTATALVTFPIQSIFLMDFVSTQLPRGGGILHPSPFCTVFAFLQHKTRYFRVQHSQQHRSPFCHFQPLGPISQLESQFRQCQPTGLTLVIPFPPSSATTR